MKNVMGDVVENQMAHRVGLISACLFLAATGLIAQDHAATNANNPIAGNPGAIASGEKLYKQTCQTCHGGDARGDRGPALAGGSFPHGGEDADLFRNVRAGIAGSGMPAFPKLTDEQLWQV